MKVLRADAMGTSIKGHAAKLTNYQDRNKIRPKPSIRSKSTVPSTNLKTHPQDGRACTGLGEYCQRSLSKLSINDHPYRSGASPPKTGQRQCFINSRQRYYSGTNGLKSLGDVASFLRDGCVSRAVICAGAGISTASGIPDFRTPGTGLYDNLQRYDIPYPEAIFDIDYFETNPRPFFAIAKELYPTGRYRPNYAHYFARLLHDKGALLRMYTQNIDGLERLAGVPPSKLVEAHGTFSTATCSYCDSRYRGHEIKDDIFNDRIPRCRLRGCAGILKPDIVFFGEDLHKKFYHYLKDMTQADLVIVMGTSLEVYPFAGIIDHVRYNVPRVLFNRDLVGPFRRPRTKDFTSLGDLVTNLRAFVDQIGWTDDIEELFLRNEPLKQAWDEHSDTTEDGQTQTTKIVGYSATKNSGVSSGGRDLSRRAVHTDIHNRNNSAVSGTKEISWGKPGASRNVTSGRASVNVTQRASNTDRSKKLGQMKVGQRDCYVNKNGQNNVKLGQANGKVGQLNGKSGNIDGEVGQLNEKLGRIHVSGSNIGIDCEEEKVNFTDKICEISPGNTTKNGDNSKRDDPVPDEVKREEESA